MTEDCVDSVAYYDRNADRFAADTVGLAMSTLYDRFLKHVPAGGRILDAGCGVGRDALAFTKRGLSVVAFDASMAMVRLAERLTSGQVDVRRLRFEDIAWHDDFDGVWACASLLHVPVASLPIVVRRLATVLRPRGALYMSFKHGHGERVVDGRRFTDLDQPMLRQVVAGSGLDVVDVWLTDDIRPNRPGETWLNVVAIRSVPTAPNV